MLKVDATKEQSLAARFPLQGYPSIYFINKGSVYEYKGPRTVEGFLQFVQGGYENNDPLDIFHSPFGIGGMTKGAFISIGLYVLNIYEVLQSAYGLPWFAAAVIVVTGGITFTLFSAAMLTWILNPKMKAD